MVNSIDAADIMIIDDQSENLKLLRDLLREQGHSVRTANSGELALASIKAKVPDLVLLDIKMPGIDGYEVCRRLKADLDTQEIPIIFLTALNDREDKVKGFKLGGSDFITKPFQTEEVLARIDNFLRIYFLQLELKTKATRIENILAGTNAGTWEWNVQTGEQESNERWAEIIGYTLDELAPISFKTFLEFAHPEDMERAQAEMNRAFNKEIPLYDIEFRMRHKDGRWVWINARGIVNSWTPDGKPLVVSGVHLDITERKQKAIELQNAQMLLKSSMESPKDMIILSIDQNYNYYYFNQAHKDAMKYAYDKDVSLGMNLLESITSEPDRIKAKANYDLALKGVSHTTIEEYGDTKIGYYETFYNPIINDKNEIVGTTAFARNISDRKQMEKQLIDSEERFQMLFNKAPLGYQSLDFDGNFIEVNEQWLAMLGYEPEEVIGKWFGDFLSPPYQDGFRKRFPIFKAQGQIHSEFEMVCKSGKKLFIAFDGKIGYDNVGEFKQTHCILKDITIEKLLEQQLEESQKLIQSIINNTTDAIYIKDIEGKYLLFNPQAEKITGKLKDDVLGKDDFYLFPPDEAKVVMDGDRAIMDNGETQTYEEIVTDATGKIAVFSSTKGPIFDEHNKVQGLFGIARNITKHKELELSLSNEKKLLEATLISVGDGVISCDRTGQVLFINPIAEDLTGWGLDEAEGKPIEEVFHIINEMTGEKGENIAKKVLESGVINELANHTILISKDGTRRPIEDSAAPIIQDNGEIIGVVIVFSDFSDKREKMDQIQYLSYHDYLTGLYNRRFFEEELKRYDTARNIPMTIVMGDVNGLKLINDSFGHDVGDELLKKAAEMIMKGCRADDVVARLGGDEFVIILPKTDALEAERLLKRIQSSLSEQMVGAIALSVSFGFETKQSQSESFQDILKNAEDHMYRHKLYESASMRSKTINLIMNTLYEKNNREMIHSQRVSELCESIAKSMDLSNDDINQIRIAGLMHDIGKIGVEDNILNKTEMLNNHEWEEIKKHSEIGYRILSSVNEFSEVADYVLEHQERWDGTGYPRGLKGEEISLQARIISVADAFDAMTGERTYGRMLNKKEAIEEIQRCSGTQFDPELARLFIEKVLNKG
jgi:diguanylate cyclase (GGDEF)-like protein/PAS domain S-box-containing protein/putative nucleotidyltransferase with HDIG domain